MNTQKPLRSRDYSFLIATCTQYPQGNEALVQLKMALEQKGFACWLQDWREIAIDSLDANTIILPLAIWDYALHYPLFLEFLEKIERNSLRIINPSALILWNLQKDYLLDLQTKDLPIIPSLILYPYMPFWEESIAQKQWINPVIKPLVGQSGMGVARLEEQIFRQNNYPLGAIVQPFIESVYTLGEVCLVFFRQEYQYAIHRKPAPREWRANSKYQATICTIEPSSQWVEIAKRVVENLPCGACYVRVDLLPQDNQRVLISEVELIEPSLYFNCYPQIAAESFIANLLCFLEN